MNTGFTSVPFKAEKHQGFSTVNGVAKFSSAGIVFEFESKLLGMIGSGVQEIRLPIAELLDVKFKKGVFKRGAKIEIRTRSFAAVAELPHQDGKVTLKISREDFERGQTAVEQLRKDMQSYNAELPPVHTPVSQLFTDESEAETQLLEKDGE
ncbi:hypothetical protein [Leptolyngbya sp. 7M]|uniref:hypothetical protein n=1 Tax=Leptolyngbya sp. 7M TaxID=2812896 RepID=UPI001B8CCC15|nr:hypothetical protein [Leptolyngbya sp. 7M]QYO66585.1 hypothetical protein JVX88_07225 [Leptolyngbya sp. 7M]